MIILLRLTNKSGEEVEFIGQVLRFIQSVNKKNFLTHTKPEKYPA